MGLEVMTCCGEMTHVNGDAGRRAHKAGCIYAPDEVVVPIIVSAPTPRFNVTEWRDNGARVIEVYEGAQEEGGEQWFSQFLPEDDGDAAIIKNVESEALAMLAWVRYVKGII